MTSNYQRSAGTITDEYYSVNSSYTIPNSSTSGWSSDTGQYMYARSNSYGNLYSWAVATAGQNNSNYSICPKGWRIPTNTEFSILINVYNASTDGSKLTQSPVNMVYGGCFDGDIGSTYLVGSYGLYWSSTAYGPTSNYTLSITSSEATATGGSSRRHGLAIRCIFST